MPTIFDSRGKAMVTGGRYRLAQHLRWLRRSGGRADARSALESAKAAYADEMRRAHDREVAYEAAWNLKYGSGA